MVRAPVARTIREMKPLLIPSDTYTESPSGARVTPSGLDRPEAMVAVTPEETVI
eukprot:CAMPEP_0184386278 /NCGR_PEP_ID=MMETSP0007-20130409/9648_1 /TAXON_ID=97485 /ORGANISM="Prymnesium parvum, Strain Texoma1" /LENGTH=53 /DNA_ID=CAMNT_0026734067 /DNA_START=104 /DNA_END=265 /DNA_ORIENTATION=-